MVLVEGGVVLAGERRDSGSAPGQTWLARLSSEGLPVWQRILAVPGNSVYVSAIVPASGNLIAAGYINGTDGGAWLFSFTRSGDLLWQKLYSQGRGWLYDLTSDGAGNVFVTGSGQAETIAARLDAAGNVVWGRRFRLDWEPGQASARAAGGWVVAGDIVTENDEQIVFVSEMDDSGNSSGCPATAGSWDPSIRTGAATIAITTTAAIDAHLSPLIGKIVVVPFTHQSVCPGFQYTAYLPCLTR